MAVKKENNTVKIFKIEMQSRTFLVSLAMILFTAFMIFSGKFFCKTKNFGCENEPQKIPIKTSVKNVKIK